MSIRRYVILERRSVGLTVFARADGNDDWTATPLTAGDILRMPEIGIEIPIIEFYADTDLSSADNQDTDGENAATQV